MKGHNEEEVGGYLATTLPGMKQMPLGHFKHQRLKDMSPKGRLDTLMPPYNLLEKFETDGRLF